MAVLRSIVFWIATTLFTLGISTVGLVTLPMHRDVTYRWCVFWARTVMRMMRGICGLDYRVLGREHIQPGPAIYALKHQSAWETIAFLEIAPPVAGVLKKELLMIPVYGWYMRRLGMVPIDRKAAGSAIRDMLRKAKEATARGRSIMIMPEGTRVAPGRTGRYNPGVAALYTSLAVPVVPVALNSGLFWGRRSLLIRPGTVTLEFLPPLKPGMDRKVFMDLLQERTEAASEKLRLEVQGEVGGATT